MNPNVTAAEIRKAGDAIDQELETQGQMAGVSKLLIVLPERHPREPDEKWLRVIERTIAPPVVLGRVGFYQSTSAVKFLN